MLNRIWVLLIVVMLPLTVVACGTEDGDGDGSGNNGANNGANNGVNNGVNNGANNGANNGGGEASCADLGNCGGDMVGVHSIEEACFMAFSQPVSDECPEAMLTIKDVTFAGTLTINADNTYRVEISSTFSSELLFPASCLPEGATAEMLCPALEADSGLDCEVEDGGCRCLGEDVEGEQEEPEVGTWAVDGGRVTLTKDNAEEGDEPDQFDFCVIGDQTTLKPVPDPDSDDDDFLMGFILRRQ